MAVYDTFLFFNEFDLLDIRINELRDAVQTFILIEAPWTHSGREKPLYFTEAKKAGKLSPIVAKELDRIMVVVPETCPGDLPSQREAWSRAALNLLDPGMFRESDTVLHGDVDEIPRSEVILRNSWKKGIFVLQQRSYYYYLNCVDPEYRWLGTRMCQVRYLKPFQDLRFWGGTILPDAGWHLSFMGGPEKIREKIEAFSCQEYNIPEFTDLEKIAERMRTPTDLFERGYRWQFTEKKKELLDLPRLIQSDPDRFQEWFYESSESMLPVSVR